LTPILRMATSGEPIASGDPPNPALGISPSTEPVEVPVDKDEELELLRARVSRLESASWRTDEHVEEHCPTCMQNPCVCHEPAPAPRPKGKIRLKIGRGW